MSHCVAVVRSERGAGAVSQFNLGDDRQQGASVGKMKLFIPLGAVLVSWARRRRRWPRWRFPVMMMVTVEVHMVVGLVRMEVAAGTGDPCRRGHQVNLLDQIVQPFARQADQTIESGQKKGGQAFRSGTHRHGPFRGQRAGHAWERSRMRPATSTICGRFPASAGGSYTTPQRAYVPV